MRIFMPVLWYDEPAGGWTYFRAEAERLAAQGNEVVVFTPHGAGVSTLNMVKLYRSPSAFILARAFVVHPVYFFRNMDRLLRNEKPMDLVYDVTSGVFPMAVFCRLWFMLKRKHTPIVIHVHGELKDLSYRPIVGRLFELYLQVFARLSFRCADAVLVASEAIIPRMVRLGAREGQIRVVRVGLKGEPAGVPSPLPHGRFTFGYVGRLTRAKGVDFLIAAFRKAKDFYGIDAKLLLVGAEGEGYSAARHVANLGLQDDVELIGWRPDVKEQLRRMDVFCNFSVSEAGMSASQIEAMEAGLPSIISASQPYLRHGWDCLRASDVYEASAAMFRLYDDGKLRKEMGENSRATIQQIRRLWSWETWDEGVKDVFKAAAQSPEGAD